MQVSPRMPQRSKYEDESGRDKHEDNVHWHSHDNHWHRDNDGHSDRRNRHRSRSKDRSRNLSRLRSHSPSKSKWTSGFDMAPLGVSTLSVTAIAEMAGSGSNAPDDNENNEENVRLQDVEWLASLSEPELDFLISLKELAIRRAKNAGYKVLGDKFNLRMLRSLGFTLMEFFKKRVQSSSEIADSDEILKLLNGCGLSILNSEVKSESNATIKGTNDLSFVSPRRKRMWAGLCEDTPKSKKRQKTADAEK